MVSWEGAAAGALAAFFGAALRAGFFAAGFFAVGFGVLGADAFFAGFFDTTHLRRMEPGRKPVRECDDATRDGNRFPYSRRGAQHDIA